MISVAERDKLSDNELNIMLSKLRDESISSQIFDDIKDIISVIKVDSAVIRIGYNPSSRFGRKQIDAR